MKYRFCDICRGGEDNLLRCNLCSRGFHIECLGLSSFPSHYKCEDCMEPNRFHKIRLKSQQFKKIRQWNQQLKISRINFLLQQKQSILPFCNEKIFHQMMKILTTKTTATTSTAASIAAAAPMNTMMTTSQYKDFLTLSKNPSFLIDTITLRDYQIIGSSRLCEWYLRGVGGILADEMGLGKTIQTITFLGNLKHKLQLSGPHLIITPLAVIQNWANEIQRFCPSISFKKIYGNKTERYSVLQEDRVLSAGYDIYLTTYESLMVEEPFFIDCWEWMTITIDEGHRIKNENTKLRQILNRLKCPFRLLLTGTPLQNNLHELWALLNYILPDIFKDSSVFDNGAIIHQDHFNRDTCKAARHLLESCFMLRRIKLDVESSLPSKKYCVIRIPLSQLQIQWYQSLLQNNTNNDDDGHDGHDGHDDDGHVHEMRGISRLHLLSMNQLKHILIQLQKIVNHPKQIYYRRQKNRDIEMRRITNAAYQGCEFVKMREELQPPPTGSTAWLAEQELKQLYGDALINSSAKLMVLDRLLIRLKAQGSRCLIFSQYTETLDILEEFLKYRFDTRDEIYFRLDGQTNRAIREINTRSFNDPRSKAFIYLISTKAGGVGINLASADTVILYDTCWNPQTDLQAEDRAHRIGQTKQVIVYRLLTANTFEERVLQRAQRKLVLDRMVIAKDEDLEEELKNEEQELDNEDNFDTAGMSFTDIIEMLNYNGAGASHKQVKASNHDESAGHLFWGTKTTKDLDEIIDKSLASAACPSLPIVSKYSRGLAFISPTDQLKKKMINSQEQTSKMEQIQSQQGKGHPLVRIPTKSKQCDKASPEIIVIADSPAKLKPEHEVINLINSGDDNEVAATATAIPKREISMITPFETSTSSNGMKSMEAMEAVKYDHGDVAIIDLTTPSSSVASSSLLPLSAHARCVNHEVPSNESPNDTKENSEKASSDEARGRSAPALKRSTRVKAPPRRYSPPRVVVKVARKKYHEDFCFCCNTGGTLLECYACPKVYHISCVGLKSVPKSTWFCPWHFCIRCDRNVSASGGVQFRCLHCPITYCFDCYPPQQEMKNKATPTWFEERMERHGYPLSKNVLYDICIECNEQFAAKKQQEMEDKRKRDALMERWRIEKQFRLN